MNININIILKGGLANQLFQFFTAYFLSKKLKMNLVVDVSNNYNFFNIDIQGTELLELLGGQKILNKLDIIYTGINYDYVYKNCALVSDIDNLLKKYNFVRYYTSDVKNKKNISVWGDAIYLKKKLVQKYN